MIHRSLRFLCPTLLGIVASQAIAGPMSLDAYMALRGPDPTARVAYGAAPSQFAELFMPPGDGPFPVAVLIHGGCWHKEFQGITQLRSMAGALTAQGIAVWNVEYRRVDEDGGGYPGTYLDMIAALDSLSATAPVRKLDLQRLVVIGHSAGGHLAQWIAGRERLPRTSTQYRDRVLPVRHIISLGALNDLRAQQEAIEKNCGTKLELLTGVASAARPDVFADTSPAELLPNGAHTVLVNGELDRLVPPATASAFADKARAAGDRVETLVLPGASHFDEVAPTSPSWALVLPRILQALEMTQKKP